MSGIGISIAADDDDRGDRCMIRVIPTALEAAR